MTAPLIAATFAEAKVNITPLLTNLAIRLLTVLIEICSSSEISMTDLSIFRCSVEMILQSDFESEMVLLGNGTRVNFALRAPATVEIRSDFFWSDLWSSQ